MLSKEVIQLVNGLNSPTTLKRWTKMAEHLAGVTFNRYRQNQYNYSKEDVGKFQVVASQKEALGLEKAILHAFAGERDPPKSISEEIDMLWNYVSIVDKECEGLAEQVNVDRIKFNQTQW